MKQAKILRKILEIFCCSVFVMWTHTSSVQAARRLSKQQGSRINRTQPQSTVGDRDTRLDSQLDCNDVCPGPCTIDACTSVVFRNPKKDFPLRLFVTDNFSPAKNIDFSESSYSLERPPAHGEVVYEGDGELLYTPFYNPAKLPDSFTYSMCDKGRNCCPCATVIIKPSPLELKLVLRPQGDLCDGNLCLTVTVTNVSKEKVKGIDIEVILPDRVMYISGGDSHANGRVFTHIDRLEPFPGPGNSFEYEIKAKVLNPHEGGEVCFEAFFTTDYPRTKSSVCRSNCIDYDECTDCPIKPVCYDVTLCIGQKEVFIEFIDSTPFAYDADTFRVTGGPNQGQVFLKQDLTGRPIGMVYLVPENFSGTDMFNYKICADILLDTCEVEPICCLTGNVIIREPDCSIELSNHFQKIDQDTQYQFNIASVVNDPAGSFSYTTVSVDGNPAGTGGLSDQGGTVSDNGMGVLTYTPPSGFSGDDFFTYDLCTSSFTCCTTGRVDICVSSNELDVEIELQPDTSSHRKKCDGFVKIEVTVKNNSYGFLTDVSTSVTLPCGMAYVSDDSFGMHQNGVLTFPSVGILPEGEEIIYIICAEVLAPENGGSYVVSAKVTANNGDVVACACSNELNYDECAPCIITTASAYYINPVSDFVIDFKKLTTSVNATPDFQSIVIGVCPEGPDPMTGMLGPIVGGKALYRLPQSPNGYFKDCFTYTVCDKYDKKCCCTGKIVICSGICPLDDLSESLPVCSLTTQSPPKEIDLLAPFLAAIPGLKREDLFVKTFTKVELPFLPFVGTVLGPDAEGFITYIQNGETFDRFIYEVGFDDLRDCCGDGDGEVVVRAFRPFPRNLNVCLDVDEGCDPGIIVNFEITTSGDYSENLFNVQIAFAIQGDADLVTIEDIDDDPSIFVDNISHTVVCLPGPLTVPTDPDPIQKRFVLKPTPGVEAGSIDIVVSALASNANGRVSLDCENDTFKPSPQTLIDVPVPICDDYDRCCDIIANSTELTGVSETIDIDLKPLVIAVCDAMPDFDNIIFGPCDIEGFTTIVVPSERAQFLGNGIVRYTPPAQSEPYCECFSYTVCDTEFRSAVTRFPGQPDPEPTICCDTGEVLIKGTPCLLELNEYEDPACIELEPDEVRVIDLCEFVDNPAGVTLIVSSINEEANFDGTLSDPVDCTVTYTAPSFSTFDSFMYVLVDANNPTCEEPCLLPPSCCFVEGSVDLKVIGDDTGSLVYCISVGEPSCDGILLTITSEAQGGPVFDQQIEILVTDSDELVMFESPPPDGFTTSSTGQTHTAILTLPFIDSGAQLTKSINLVLTSGTQEGTISVSGEGTNSIAPLICPISANPGTDFNTTLFSNGGGLSVPVPDDCTLNLRSQMTQELTRKALTRQTEDVVCPLRTPCCITSANKTFCTDGDCEVIICLQDLVSCPSNFVSLELPPELTIEPTKGEVEYFEDLTQIVYVDPCAGNRFPGGFVYFPIDDPWIGPDVFQYKVCQVPANSDLEPCCVAVTVVIADENPETEKCDLTLDINISPPHADPGQEITIFFTVANESDGLMENINLSVKLPSSSLVYKFSESMPVPSQMSMNGQTLISYDSFSLAAGEFKDFLLQADLVPPGGNVFFESMVTWNQEGMNRDYNVNYPLYLPHCFCVNGNLPIILNNIPVEGGCPLLPDENGCVTIDVCATFTLPPDSPWTIEDIIDDEGFNLIIAQQPKHGTAVVNGCEVKYTASSTFAGCDEFTYEVLICEEGGVQCSGTARIVIGCCIVAKDICVGACQGMPIAIDVVSQATDPEGFIDPSCTKIVQQPKNGCAEVDSKTGEIIYTPNGNFTSGEDHFTYSLSDSCKNCAIEGEVTVIVSPSGESALDSDVARKYGRRKAPRTSCAANCPS